MKGSGNQRAVCPECGYEPSFNEPGSTVFCPEIETTVELVTRSVDAANGPTGGDS